MSLEHTTSGGTVSVIVTANVQLADEPEASVAVHVTVVLPFGNPLPDGGTHTTGSAPPPASVAVTV